MMKNSIIKVICATFTFTILVSSITGCSVNKSGKSGETSQQTQTAKNDEPVFIKFLCPSYDEIPDLKNQYWTELQKLTNSKLEIQFIPNGYYNTKLDLMLASNDLPEVVNYPNQERPNLVSAIKQGAFWNLSPILGDFSGLPNLKKNAETGVFNYTKVDGNIYAIPAIRAKVDNSLKIRKDWLDKFNIPVPTTLNEYRDALKKIIDNDPDGNGKKDTIGFVQHEFDTLHPAFQSAFGVYKPTYNEEGGMIKENLTPQYTDMVEWFAELYKEGILAKEWPVIKNTQAEELFLTGQVVSYVRNTWRDWPFEQAIKKIQPDAKVMSLPPIKGPGGYTVELSTGYYGAHYINKKVSEGKVKQIIKYFEKTASPEVHFLAYNGIKDIHYKIVDGQPQLTEQGKKEINVTSLQTLVLSVDPWAKVVTMLAPKTYNDAKKIEVADYEKYGSATPFAGIISDTWTNTWPKYESEWQAMVIKVVVGQISLDEYKSYVKKLNNNADIKRAYKEFAKAYGRFTAK